MRRYFPGPDFWETDRSPDAPERPRTSGIVQPPIHATAAWQVYLRGDDRRRAAAFLEELFPRLEAWHGYLYRERCRNRNGLAEIWHPWESGMDNSPLWDEALERMSPDAARIPEYERVDVRIADASERPSDAEYDRYVYLVGLFRELAYEPSRIREAAPFALQPVLFNSLLVRSNRGPGRDRACARVGRRAVRDVGTEHGLRPREPVGRGAGAVRRLRRHRRKARQRRVPPPVSRPCTQACPPGAERSAWSNGSRAPASPVGALGLGRDQPLARRSGLPADALLARTGVADPELGLQRGLDRYGYRDRAEQVRRAVIELGRNAGFWEHYDPLTGRGHGGEQFAWTAALVLDLLHTDGSRARAGETGH